MLHLNEDMGEYRRQFEGVQPSRGQVHIRRQGGRGRIAPVSWLMDWHRLRAIPPPAPLISILIGESVYNLRAALDYLVYELAWLDSGQVQEGTQFPIDKSQTEFKRSCKRFLAGVNPTHCDWIEQFQPYNGCKWTPLLQALSNPDKHKQLTHVRKYVSSTQRAVKPPVQTETGMTVDVEDKMVASITIQGVGVENALRTLHEEVGKVLALFDPEF